jgi:Sulfotransferase family
MGEFHCLWRLPADQITCSCASTFKGDEFWQAVLKDAQTDAATISELAHLEHRIARTSFIARHRFSLEALTHNPDVQRFLAIQFALFESVARLADKPIIVDSSKAGPRAWLLACDPRTRFIHLYRDPADVIASWRSAKFDLGLNAQMKRMPVSTAALDWWKVEQLMRIMGKQRAVTRVDYGALCASPEAIMAQAIAQLELADETHPQWIDNMSIQQGEDYHSLNGNPDRFERGTIRISQRTPDWRKMPPAERYRIRAAGAAIRMIYPSEM